VANSTFSNEIKGLKFTKGMANSGVANSWRIQIRVRRVAQFNPKTAVDSPPSVIKNQHAKLRFDPAAYAFRLKLVCYRPAPVRN
jgi:hypothetical protein